MKENSSYGRYLFIGLLVIGLGVITLIDKTVPARPWVGWLPVPEAAAYAVGVLVILCGLYPLYLGIKIFLKSRRS
ncbi:MAG: hypothetical protein HY541_06665 [Deltaproteobacteria bacterium]|nr:hypothetical protein [Deltaproteobacteria bacterium]